MPICHKNRLVFFHIPRCGGTSMQRSYNFHGKNTLQGVVHIPGKALTLHHLTYADLLAEGLIEGSVLESYFKFTIIRDPFDRIHSDFYWQKKNDIHGVFSDLNFSEYLDFAEQVINKKKYFDKVHFDHFRPMVEYCLDGRRLLLDEILILENIDEELKRLPNSFGIHHLPKDNSSEINSTEARTAEHTRRVYDLYREDKELYDRLCSERSLLTERD